MERRWEELLQFPECVEYTALGPKGSLVRLQFDLGGAEKVSGGRCLNRVHVVRKTISNPKRVTRG